MPSSAPSSVARFPCSVCSIKPSAESHAVIHAAVKRRVPFSSAKRLSCAAISRAYTLPPYAARVLRRLSVRRNAAFFARLRKALPKHSPENLRHVKQTPRNAHVVYNVVPGHHSPRQRICSPRKRVCAGHGALGRVSGVRCSPFVLPFGIVYHKPPFMSTAAAWVYIVPECPFVQKCAAIM